MAVAVPASVRLLLVEKTLRQRVHTLVGDPERHHRVERVALLRGAAAVAAAHERNAATAVGLRLRPRRAFVEVARAEPELDNALTQGMKAFVTFGIADVGEAGEDPVKPLPLVIDLPRGAGAAELVAPREKRADDVRAADLAAKQTNRFAIGILAQHVDARLPADGRLRRLQQRRDRTRVPAFHERQTYEVFLLI